MTRGTSPEMVAAVAVLVAVLLSTEDDCMVVVEPDGFSDNPPPLTVIVASDVVSATAPLEVDFIVSWDTVEPAVKKGPLGAGERAAVVMCLVVLPGILDPTVGL